MSICDKCKSEASIYCCDRCGKPMNKFIEIEKVKEALEGIQTNPFSKLHKLKKELKMI